VEYYHLDAVALMSNSLNESMILTSKLFTLLIGRTVHRIKKWGR
jgi:hypothetical protein